MGLITPGLGLIFWSALGFLIVLFLLTKYAWKPILAALDEREKSIDDALKSAEIARNEMANLKAENERIIHEAKIERDTMLHKASEAAKQMIDEAKEKAHLEGAKMIENAKATIETEKQAAIEDIKVQVGILSLAVAEKLLKKNFSEDAAQQKLVEELVKDIKLN
ncbi:F0F1 ATP synthase subunit B [Aquiflexum gelatinilyticum]|jgi:F-type H+-transporting ATPase subunit b|uniref:ATP synthase subunit b n=1 Tax=Aquiflexum gelatinilyticum TaxID=2961943 RepID=A0A9X2P8Z0_9BACT|nr:F0F1 ATP synthase subunit B [Aquiflexum gelatinilyticum]MCR9014290.1 F0F1 ATP synthase subunit B [Aquiflexum gelatinilyticum]MCS4435863.1 F0F1 ATP synthase subunit B [Aquiflexum gelatinilyticum]